MFGMGTDKLEKRVTTLEVEMDEAQGNIQTLQAEMNTMEDLTAQHTTRLEELQTEIDNKAATIKSTEVPYTLSASGWVGESAPYAYDLTSTYPDDKYDVTIWLDEENATVEQREAIMNANTSSCIKNVLVANGEKPTIDIPVILELVDISEPEDEAVE
jgi:chaperonin cofactor prefoldin